MPVVVVGGGQAGLAASYYLRRAGIEHVVLDDQDRAGGAWVHTWPSLRLFSPAAYSSLPGWPMPRPGAQNPTAAHVVDYLTRYEARYQVPVRRGVRVRSVSRAEGLYEVRTDRGKWSACAVVSATGTWCTRTPPRYLPDDVDGRELFRVANLRVRGLGEGVAGLGDIVAVPPVRSARDAGVLSAVPMVQRFTADGAQFPDGSVTGLDAVVWCTGFRPALGHLRGASLAWRAGHPLTEGPTVADRPALQFVGYGDWCGAASATLVGVGQWARTAVSRIQEAQDRPRRTTIGPGG